MPARPGFASARAIVEFFLIMAQAFTILTWTVATRETHLSVYRAQGILSALGEGTDRKPPPLWKAATVCAGPGITRQSPEIIFGEAAGTVAAM